MRASERAIVCVCVYARACVRVQIQKAASWAQYEPQMEELQKQQHRQKSDMLQVWISLPSCPKSKPQPLSLEPCALNLICCRSALSLPLPTSRFLSASPCLA